MSEQAAYTLQVISTLSVLLPILIGSFRFMRYDPETRLFIAFLFIGLLADLAGWYCFLTRNATANLYVRHGYDLIESLFLLWLISRFSTGRFLPRLFPWLLPLFLLFWSARFVYIDAMSMYKTSTQVLFSFATAIVILQIIETHRNVGSSIRFWILLGIFFYCFTTYFVMGLLVTKLAKVWYLHNIVNITTNLIYGFGFARASRVRS